MTTVEQNVMDTSSSSSSSEPLLQVQRLTENAVLPVRGSALAAGYDLSSAYDVEIKAQGKAIVKTDLAISMPEGVYGRIAPRSGLAWKKHVDVGAGVIDRDYTGNVGVVLFNHAQESLFIKHGDRIAQLILERHITCDVVEVDTIQATDRGSGGFGSTGMNKIAKTTEDSDVKTNK